MHFPLKLLFYSAHISIFFLIFALCLLFDSENYKKHKSTYLNSKMIVICPNVFLTFIISDV